MKYWDYEKNDEAGLFPSKIKSGSSKKCHFKCLKGHSFTLLPHSKKISGNDNFECKICNPCGRKVKLLKDFLDEDKKKYFKQDNNPGVIFSVLPFGSTLKLNWECPNGHIFKKRTKHFSSHTGSSCPKCRIIGLQTGTGNSRSFTLGNLADNKELMKEWSSKNILNPKYISLGDNRTKVWWKCGKCFEHWKARVYSRSGNKSGCPLCGSKRNQSRNEIRIFSEMSFLFNNVQSNYKIDGYKYDIYIKDINLLIEYDGSKWHSDNKSIENDIKKNKLANKNGYNIIRVREKGLPKMSINDIILNIPRNNLINDDSQIHILSLILEYISEQYTLNFESYISNFINEKKFSNEKDYYLKINQGVVDNNLTKHPKLNEFCKTKNKIDPKCIAMGSKMKVWWKCDKGIDHSWEENPNNRKIGGCPFCSNKRISITNRLDIIEPKSIKSWSNKNRNKPSDYTNRNSKDDIVWNCNHCKKEFYKTIDRMIDTNGYCPHCKNYHFK